MPSNAAPFEYTNSYNTADFRTSFDLIKTEPITNFSSISQKIFDHESSFKGPKMLDYESSGMIQALDGNRISEVISDDLLDGSARMSDFSCMTQGNNQMTLGPSPSPSIEVQKSPF